MAMTFLVLGGYGNTGRLIARLLLQESDVHVVLAGRSLERATAEAAGDWLPTLRLWPTLRRARLRGDDAGGDAIPARLDPWAAHDWIFVGGFNWFADWVAIRADNTPSNRRRHHDKASC